MNLSRRGILGLLAGATLDPERLLHVPGKIVYSIPKPPNYGILMVDFAEFAFGAAIENRRGCFFNSNLEEVKKYFSKNEKFEHYDAFKLEAYQARQLKQVGVKVYTFDKG